MKEKKCSNSIWEEKKDKIIVISDLNRTKRVRNVKKNVGKSLISDSLEKKLVMWKEEKCDC